MRKKILLFFVLLVSVLISGCFYKSKKAQTDFDVICNVYKDGLKKLSASPESLTATTIQVTKDLESKINNNKVKVALEAILHAPIEQKYLLIQKSAEELNAKFECPDYDVFMFKADQINNTKDSEGDPNETL